MAVGGNHKARQFFKQHGWDETGSDKIESKVGIMRLQGPPVALCVQVFHDRVCFSQLPCCIHIPYSYCAVLLSYGAARAASSQCQTHANSLCMLVIPPKQYTSRAAQLYRAQLEKEAAKLAGAQLVSTPLGGLEAAAPPAAAAAPAPVAAAPAPTPAAAAPRPAVSAPKPGEDVMSRPVEGGMCDMLQATVSSTVQMGNSWAACMLLSIVCL